MKISLLKQLGIITALVLAILVVLQSFWLWQQLEQEKQAFQLKLENSLQSIANFHALQGYSTPDPKKPDTATLIIEETTTEEIEKDTTHQLGKYEISTKKYIENFSLYKALEAAFTDISLKRKKIQVKVIDSLFQNHFSGLEYIGFYKMQLSENGVIVDSLYSNKNRKIILPNNSPKTIEVEIPLGTKGIFVFTADFQLKTFPFLRQMLYSISVSGLAVVFVALFMLWFLWALQRKEAQLQWRERAVSGIVHDLKSPLSYIYTFLDYLATKEQQPTMQEQLGNASANVSKLTHKMELLLTLFRSKKQKISMMPSPYPLAKKCRELVSELELIYQEKKPECHLSVPDDLSICVDTPYFDAALRNLLDNALKYSDSPAKLNVETNIKQKEFYICITDLGKGIPHKEQRKIFQEFYRTDSQTKGHGIGLAFAQQVIKTHKGRISLQSEVGKGSRFCIVLPASILL